MNPDFFKHYRSNTLLDNLLSTLGGLPKGVNYMVIGDPGVGKTTVMLDLIANIKANNPNIKTLFISAEMNEIDLFVYVQRYPKFGDIEILFIEKDIENINNNYENVRNVLNEGWDIVVLDSFSELQNIIKEEQNINIKSSESLLLSLIKNHNKALNDKNISTTFLTIQQVTKSGVFTGSNRLKHMITAMMELRLENKNNIYADRYITFSKHRRGNVGLKLYYDLSNNNHVSFDKKRFEFDQKMNLEKQNLAQQLRDFTADFENIL
jgi:predicted ATP-dependent serine protease